MASLSIATKEEEEEIQQGTRQLIRRFSQDVAENVLEYEVIWGILVFWLLLLGGYLGGGR